MTGLFFFKNVNGSSPFFHLSRVPPVVPIPITDTVPHDHDADTAKLPRPVRAPLVNDTTDWNDTLTEKVDTFAIKASKDSLDAPIAYSAQDSVVLEVPTHNITLFNKANTKYKDIVLDAYKIKMDQAKELLVATYVLDSNQQKQGRPKMSQADNNTESDTLVYNLKTQKGLTMDTYTQSGEMFVHSEKSKKISKDEYFAYRGRFTTCNLDTPHFAFRTNKMKLINKKFAITGPVHPEFEGVPIPIYIPFGFFPISQGRHSGFLPPTFDVSAQYGLGLTGLGYYKVINDNFDVITHANVYSYGGWKLSVEPEYRVRYRYSGRLNFNLQRTRILSQTGKTEFQTSKTWQLNWGHTVDSKARPGQTFSANLNLMSTKYNRYDLTNPYANFTNQISSSINYSKTWEGKYNLSVGLNHNQNNQTGLINVSFPNLSFTATTLYPFQEKDFVGTPKWYQKLGIGLNTVISGSSSFYDSLFSIQHAIDTFQFGAQHNIPISLALPPLGPFQISPGISLSNRMYSRRYQFLWNDVRKKVDTVNVGRGLYDASDMGFSLSMSTALYGVFQNFGKKSNVLGIRHVVRPTISLNYRPDLNSQYYHNIQVDTFGHYQNFSDFQGSIYGPFSQGVFGGLSFGLDNNIEMKVRDKTDTTAGASKKVKIIDGIGFNGSYNYLADSFKLSPITMYLRSTLFENVNITAGATLDPYLTDSLGFRVNRYSFGGKGGNESLRGVGLGRITGGNVAISTSFKSKPKDTKQAEDDKKNADDQNALPMTLEEQEAELNYIRAHPAQFADFNIAWSVNLSYSLNFSKVLQPNYRYKTNINSTLLVNADFNLTEKWKVGFNTYFDVTHTKISLLTGFLTRDMHCWQMAINVTPVGPYRSFSITINPKSGILRDLKINRNRTFY